MNMSTRPDTWIVRLRAKRQGETDNGTIQNLGAKRMQVAVCGGYDTDVIEIFMYSFSTSLAVCSIGWKISIRPRHSFGLSH